MEKLNKKETKQLWEALEMIASMCVSLATGEKVTSPWTGKRLTRKEVKHFHFMTHCAFTGRCDDKGWPIQTVMNRFMRELQTKLNGIAAKAAVRQ
jgi:hypothetical protein